MQDTLARKLRLLRADKGWTLREAAPKLGVTPGTLSELERGARHPQDVTLAKIAKGYGVPAAKLLEEPVPLGKAEAPEEAAGPEVAFPLDIDQIRREVAGDDWANSWPTQMLKKAVEEEIERRYTNSERIEFRRRFAELSERLAPDKFDRFEEYAKAVEGFGYVSRVLEKTANPQHV